VHRLVTVVKVTMAVGEAGHAREIADRIEASIDMVADPDFGVLSLSSAAGGGGAIGDVDRALVLATAAGGRGWPPSRRWCKPIAGVYTSAGATVSG